MKRLITLVVFSAYLFSGGFGFLHAFGATPMQMPMAIESISPCPFMSDTHMLCDMSVIEHISAWQHAFAGTLTDALLLMMLCFTVLLRLKRTDRELPQSFLQNTISAINLAVLLPTLMQRLFTKGILHPKLFALL